MDGSDGEDEIVVAHLVRSHSLVASVTAMLTKRRLVKGLRRTRRRSKLMNLWRPFVSILRTFVVGRNPNIHRDWLAAIHEMRSLSHEDFKRNFRMSRAAFYSLLQKVK